jgi:hypothetical protein
VHNNSQPKGDGSSRHRAHKSNVVKEVDDT